MRVSRLCVFPSSSKILLGVSSLNNFTVLEPVFSVFMSILAQGSANLIKSMSLALYEPPLDVTNIASSRFVLPLALGPTIIFTPWLSSKEESLYDRKFCNRRSVIIPTIVAV